MNREKYIQLGILNHLNEFHRCYPNLELFGLFIQGSQNYGLDIYTDEYKSDIDTKAIVIPSLEDVVMNKKPVSTTHILPNNEHLDIKDIRLYFDNFKKQNINFVEILFACGNWINKDYKDLYDLLITNRELIAHYNTNQALRCMAGMSMEKKKALRHPYPSLIDKIEKYGYDGKQLHHIIRMNNFIFAYGEGKTFEECLKYLPNKKEMMKAKLNQYTEYEALVLAQDFDNKTILLKNKYLKEKDEINKEALEVLNKVQYEAIKRKIKKEVM